MKRLKCDMLMYFGLLVISLLFWFIFIPQQIALRGSWSGDIVFTSRTFPYILFAVLGMASVAGMIQTAFRIMRLPAEERKAGAGSFGLRPILIACGFFALTGVYAWMFSTWGYVVSTAVIVPVYLLALKCRKWQYFVITYGFSALVYVVFKLVLKIPL